MSTTENVFKGDRTLIVSVDIERPLADAKEPCCEYYMSAYARAAQQSSEKGELVEAETFRSLNIITSFFPSFDTPAQPFGPYMQMEGKRGYVPSDLTGDDIETVRDLSKVAKDPALRSRLYDVLWELTKDYKCCSEAAGSYIEAAERLNGTGHWTSAVSCYHRGLYLAAKLGREKELFKTASESLQQAVRKSATDTEEFRCCRYLRMLIRFGCGDPKELADIAAGRAIKAEAAGNHYAARHYRDVEADLHGWAKNPAAEKAARLAAAETHVLEADARAKGPGASAMAGAALLQNGIEALRRAGERAERIAELRKRLTELQKDSINEMHTVSTPIDLSKAVEVASAHVKCDHFPDAVFKFALGHSLTDPQKIREDVLKTAEDHPMLHLFGATIMDEKGRTTAKKEPLLQLKGDEFEAELEVEMFSHAAQFVWPLRVSGYIEPARCQIFSDHHPAFQDLLFLVQDHPFIPPGHEGIFLRGIHAGFHGDFLVATHLLVPQIENSMRHVLELNGVDVSNLMSDGTQPVKVLGPLFSMAQTKAIFGENFCFELRGCLIEKTGFDFRNQVAHGFVTEGQCYSPAAVTLWWLILRLLAIPILKSMSHKGVPAAGSGPAPEKS